MIPSQMFALGDGDSDYDIPYSLRLRGSSLANLSRSFPSTNADTSLTKKTYNIWVKRGSLTTAAYQAIISNYVDASNYWGLWFSPTDNLYFYNTNGSSPGSLCNKISTQVFRDVAGWYNIQLTIDTTQTIPEERVKITVNGTRITSFSTNTLPSQNTYVGWLASLASSMSARIGAYAGSSQYMDGYQAEIIAIDGQALTASYFGKFSDATGQWTPIKYSGSYGNNGFYLDFKDFSSLTNLGYDKSGNSNHWTVNNASLTAGATYDSMIDTPTNNFATLNAVDKNANGTINSANLGITAGAQWLRTKSTIGIKSGKYYWETQHSVYNQSYQGICDDTFQMGTNNALGTTSGWSAAYNQLGDLWINNVNTAGFGAALTLGDIVGWALDMDNGTLQVYKNGVLQGTVVTGLNAKGTIYPAFSLADSAVLNVNFGQRPFAYTPPTGFSKLCSKNLPIPAVKRGETGFDVVTYTGNGGNLQIGEYQYPRPNYLIDKSLRLKGTNSYLNRTPAVSGNRQKWTFSAWVKRGGGFGVLQGLMGSGITTGAGEYFGFNASNQLILYAGDGSNSLALFTNEAYETSDWMHILVMYDSAQALLADRGKIFVNDRLQSLGTQILTLNRNSYIPYTARSAIGSVTNTTASSNYFEGYIAEVHFIDGQALDPTNFGEFDINGYWIPKAYSGTYGQNGYYLDFEDISSVTALGYDKSGQGNNWTVNNVSLTAGMTYDSMIDTPTNVVGVLDDLKALASNVTVSEGALRALIVAGSAGDALSTPCPNTGKWYFEFTVSPAGTATNGFSMGIAYGPSLTRTAYNCFGAASVFYEGVDTAYGSILVTNDVVGVAYDLDAGWVEFYVNGVAKGKLNISKSAYEAGGSVYPFIGNRGNGGGGGVFNFGQKAFIYTPPTDHKSLAIANFAEYTKDLESPDLVWIKCRNAAQNHMLFDSARGASKYLIPNVSNAEATDVNSLISFNKNGFYLGNSANVNTLNNTYVAWMFKKAIALGIDIFNFTMTVNGINTIPHSLGIPPDFIIIKSKDTTSNWFIYIRDVTTLSQYLALDTANAITASADLWGTVAPNSLNFSFKTANVGSIYDCYVFAQVEGFSKVGSYVGNGSTDGPFLYCGFKPKMVLVKWTSVPSPVENNTGAWCIYDSERDPNNDGSTFKLFPNTEVVENGLVGDSPTGNVIDFLSNGFKCRGTGNNMNGAGGNYTYIAFAECPSKYATAR